MERLEPTPDYIKKSLALREIWPAAVQLTACADLSSDREFCEVWIAITDEKLVVLKGTKEADNAGSRKSRAAVTSGKDAQVWQENMYTEYLLQDVDSLKVENLVSCGMLTVVIHGEDAVVCCFTNSHTRKFSIMAKLIGKIKEGNELTDEDLKDDRPQAFCPKCGRLYPDPERQVCPKCLDKRSIFMRVLSFVPRYKLHISLILACMLLSSALNLTGPYLGGQVLFDDVLLQGGKYYGRIGEVVLLIIFTRLIALLAGVAYGRINSTLTVNVVYDLKSEIFSAMQRLSLSFYNNKQTGSLMTRINHDTQQLQDFFNDGLPYFIVNAVNIIGIGTLMFMLNWKLAILVLLPTPFIVVYLKKVFPNLWRLFSRRFRKSSIMNALINDTLKGVRVVKAFGKESDEVSRFIDSNEGVYSVDVNLGKMIHTMFPLIHFGMGIGGLIVWGFGGWQVTGGNLTFGTLMTFVGYIGMIYGPLDFMTRIIDWWSACMNSAQRVFEIIDAVPEVAEMPDAVRVTEMKGKLELRNVTFSYVPNKPVLHDVSLDIKAGEMIGLVGHSGAGKSTIANLITRLYDVKQGGIYIDGVNIREIAIRDLRSQIGMVMQETFLFMGSIAENIAYARPDASMEDIINAAKSANAHDFIIKLPDGYDTQVGTGGRDLSGGEKQRVSIARAILHNPRILILDEATSSVDTETELQIQESLESLIKGRTTISIAHRLSTLRNADRLVVLEEGRIAECGTHAELIRKKGAYYKLVQKQSEALKIKGVGD